MAATVSLSAGPLTTIRTTTTGAAAAGNVPSLLQLNPSDLTGGSAQGPADIPDEIVQFINLLSVGGGGVAGWGFNFWTTAVFVTKCLQALTAKGAPSSSSPR